MHPKSYPLPKRTLIAAMPFDKLMELANGVQGSHLKSFIQRFRPVAGFRPGSPADTQQRLRVFFQGREKWVEDDWLSFRQLWLSWVHSHDPLSQALTNFDNTADFPEGGEEVPPNSELDVQCFYHLAREGVSRELVEIFYELGYFLPNEHIEAIIQLTKTQTELDLPRELELATGRILAVEERLRELERKLETNYAALTDAIQSNSRTWDAATTSKIVSSVKAVQEGLAADLEALRGDWTQLRGESSKNEFALRNLLSDGLRSLQDKLADSIQQLQAAQADFGVRLSTLEMSPPQVEAPTSPVSPVTPSIQSVGTQVELEFGSQRVDCEPYEDINSAVVTLGTNFRALGLKKDEAFPLADEIMAALLAGQISMFQGSLGPVLADICAQTLSCTNYVRLRIPVGLLDGRSLRLSLDEVLNSCSPSTLPVAIILEGINLSSIEAYGDCLRKMVTERLLGLNPENRLVLMLGTVAIGAGALEVSPELCDLGPIFDTDALFIKTHLSDKSLQVGRVEANAWLEWTGSAEKRPDGWDEAYQTCLKSLGLIPPLVKRALFTAYGFMNPPENRPESWPTRLQSLVYGWILPRLFASGADLTEWVDSEEVLGGRFDGDCVEPRIDRLLGGMERTDD